MQEDISPTIMLASPSIMKALAMENGQTVYMQHLSPPIAGLLKDIKHLRIPDINLDSKQLALSKLKEQSSQQPHIQNPYEDEQPSFSLKEMSGLPDGHVVLPNHPNVRRWDIIR
jgi:hypothetical protein